MSPAVSQQWDYETMSTLSQPVVLDEPLEEAQKPSRCQLLGARFKAAGGAPRHCPDITSETPGSNQQSLLNALLCLYA